MSWLTPRVQSFLRRRYSSATLRILWSPKFHYRVLQTGEYNSRRPSPYFKVQFNVVSLYMPRFSIWSLSFMFHHQNSICVFVLPLAFYLSWTSLSPCFCLFSSTWRGVKIIVLLLMQFFSNPTVFYVWMKKTCLVRQLCCCTLLHFCFLCLPSKRSDRRCLFSCWRIYVLLYELNLVIIMYWTLPWGPSSKILCDSLVSQIYETSCSHSKPSYCNLT